MMIEPDLLLHQAGKLARGAIAPRRESEMCRAISTAYYAVFHAGLIAAADLFVGVTERGSNLYVLVYRSVDHIKFKALCAEVVRAKPTPRYEKYYLHGGYGPDIVGYAEAFGDLYEKRIAADYDPSARFTNLDGEVAVKAAQVAVSRLASADPERLCVFLTLLLFPPR